MTRLRERAAKAAITASWVALFTGIGTTLAITQWLRVEESQRAAERFDLRVAETVGAIKNRLAAYEQALRGGVGLWDATGAATRSEWRAYVQALHIEDRYPGIQGMGFVRRVRPAELAAHVRQVRREGFPEYAVTPAGERAEYTPIVYIEPFNERNQRAFGYDMMSEPVRRAAMERARDEAATVMSGKVTLLQETDTDVQAGFLMYLPVYRYGASTDSVAARRDALVGYVYAPFRMNDFMRGLLQERAQDVAVEIFDAATAAEDALMYAAGEPAGTTAHARTVTIDLNNRQWTARLSALPAFDARRDWHRPGLVFALGVSASLLLWLVLRAMAETQRRAVKLAARITAALRDSESLHRLVLDTAHDGFVEMDGEGRIVEWNREAAAMFGWTREEAVGRTVAELIIPPSQRPAHSRGLQRYAETGESSGVMNRRLELAALHRSGKQFPIEATIVPITVQGKQIFSAFLRDISERVQSELRLHESLAELKRSNNDLEQFAYIASHDMQEPLRAVTGCLQLLERRNRDRFDDASRELFGHAVSGAQRMRQLIDDLLVYSRVNSRAKPPEPVDAGELVDEIIKELAVLIAERRAHVAVERLPLVMADRVQLRQVLQNLISNGIKFCNVEAPRISIGVERRGDAWVFTVADNGIGIEAQYFDRIFVAFQRLHTRDEYPGSGIGLAVCKKVIERHGGRIWVESAPGRGSRFFFSLPVVEFAAEGLAA